jgi:hypothetical protein
VHPGQTVWVTMTDARKLTGRVQSVSASALEIADSVGTLAIPLADVSTIEVADSMKNGARNGAIAGGAALGLYFGLLSHALRCDRDCGAGYSSARDTIGAVTFGAGVGAGAGAVFGLLIDHLLKGRQVVYTSIPRGTVGWELHPHVSTHDLRIHAVARW